MSAHEPGRILSAGSEASPALKRLMRSAAHDGPSAEQVSHLEDRLHASFAAGLPLAVGKGIAAGSAMKAAVAAKATSAWTAWIAVAAVSASVSGGAALYVRSRAPSHAPAVQPTAVHTPRSASPHGLAEPAPTSQPVEEAPLELPRHRAPAYRTALVRGSGSAPEPEPDTPAIPVATVAPPPGAESQPEDAAAPASLPESTVLAEAFRALHGGDARAALEWASRHAQLYPRSEMGQERDAISIEALVKLGRPEEARRSLASFKKRYPTSGYAWRLDALVSQ